MTVLRPGDRGLRHAVLLAVAASLIGTALLAIAILLVGDFGATEGRILATTTLIAGYGLLAVPGGFLIDQQRGLSLAAASLVAAAAGLALAVTVVWWEDPPDAMGKALGTATVVALACAQTAALFARRRDQDSGTVRRLYVVSCVLAFTAAGMFAVGIWGGIEDPLYFRVLGSLAVLDLLVVALQPLLAMTRLSPRPFRLAVVVEPGERFETSVEAGDFAAAAAKAIRRAEKAGHQVLEVDRRS